MPLSMAQKKDRYDIRIKEPTVGGPMNMKKTSRHELRSNSERGGRHEYNIILGLQVRIQ